MLFFQVFSRSAQICSAASAFDYPCLFFCTPNFVLAINGFSIQPKKRLYELTIMKICASYEDFDNEISRSLQRVRNSQLCGLIFL